METKTLTLPEFLLACIAEDIGLARQVQAQAVTDRIDPGDPRLPHLTLAARVLAGCDAKRRIVEWHKNWPMLVEEPPTFEQSDAENFDHARGETSSLTMRMSQRIAWMTEQEYRNRFGTEPPTGPVLRLLALPYADRPGYRDEWRP